MKFILLKFVLIIAISFNGTNTFGEDLTITESSLEPLLKNAGFKQLLNRTPVLIQDSLKQQLQLNPSQLNQPTQEKIILHSLAILHPSLLEQDIIKYLQDTFTAEEKQQLITFFNGPSYQIFRQLREGALNPEQTDSLLAYHQKLKTQPVNHYRKQLMVAIDKASHQSLLESRLHIQTYHSLNQLIKKLVADSPLNTPADWEKTTFSQYQDFHESIHFYSFRKTPNTELEHYLAELNHPLYQRFFSSVNIAIEQSITQRLNSTIVLIE